MSSASAMDFAPVSFPGGCAARYFIARMAYLVVRENITLIDLALHFWTLSALVGQLRGKLRS